MACWVASSEEGISLAELFSYTIPSLVQGISQQPDPQRDPTQGEIQINAVSSLSEGLRKRDGSRALAKVSTSDFGDAFIHSILRDTSEKYLVVITKTAIRVFDLAGNEKTVNAPGGYSYLSSVTDAKSQIRAVTIADYTFISNTLTSTAMDAAVAPEVARPAAHEALIWVKAANYGQTYTATVNGTTASVQTAVAPVIVSGSTTTENRISTADIADSIKTGLAGVSGVTITRQGSVLHLTSSSAITLKVSDARANADITAITNSVQAFTELPTIAPQGYQVEIVGDPGNRFDGYYVKFVPRTGAGTFGEGSWQEIVSPGVEYKVNAATMPHILVRLSSGQFYFGKADGTTYSGLTLPIWGQRGAGDYETAPDPSFIGYPINDLFIYKNRLGILADENVVLSRTRDFFEFFPETVTAVLDTDPIDITASNQRVSVLRYAVPYQDELILFSDQYQFRFNSAETVLTPATAQITVLTQFEIDPKVRPIQVAGAIVFAQKNGEWTQFREFSVRGAGTALVADAQSLTEYCSTYIPSDIYKLTANDTGNAWYSISARSGHLNRIYTYKYFYRNSGGGAERAQSSWSYWQLSGADKILQILCIEEVLYMLCLYGSEVWLEKMPVSDRQEDTSSTPYPLLLDRQVTTTTATPAAIRVASGTYNATTKVTTWTLPYTIKAKTQAWSMYSTTQNGGVLLGQATSGSTITASGDWSGKAVVFGELYEMRYRFTRFKLYKEIGGGKAAANLMRTQVRKALLRYHESFYFEAHVFAERRTAAVYKFDGTQLGVRNALLGSTLTGNETALDTDRYYEGVFNIPVLSKGENAIVELRNSTPHPCKFSTCEWVGLITGQARSMQ